MFYIYPEKNLRAYPGTLRGTAEWDSTYKIRVNVEKSINHFTGRYPYLLCFHVLNFSLSTSTSCKSGSTRPLPYFVSQLPTISFDLSVYAVKNYTMLNYEKQSPLLNP